MEAGTGTRSIRAGLLPFIVLRLDDRQDWRDTPHIAIYVVLYPEIHIIYFRTWTHAYYAMPSALILLTYDIEILFVFLLCYGGNHVGCVTYSMGRLGLGNFVVLLVASCFGPRQKHFGGVGRSCTGRQRYMATTNRGEPPTITQRHQDIYLP